MSVIGDRAADLIDRSDSNGPQNWQALRVAFPDCRHAVIKASEGSLVFDSQYRPNMAGAAGEAFHCHAYHVVGTSPASSEFSTFSRALAGLFDPELGRWVLDLERGAATPAGGRISLAMADLIEPDLGRGVLYTGPDPWSRPGGIASDAGVAAELVARFDFWWAHFLAPGQAPIHPPAGANWIAHQWGGPDLPGIGPIDLSSVFDRAAWKEATMAELPIAFIRDTVTGDGAVFARFSNGALRWIGDAEYQAYGSPALKDEADAGHAARLRKEALAAIEGTSSTSSPAPPPPPPAGPPPGWTFTMNGKLSPAPSA